MGYSLRMITASSLSDAAIAAALARGSASRASEPRATSARFDARSSKLTIDLTNDCTFTLPPRLIQGLAEARNDQLARVELLGDGYGLHWPDLDLDITVPGLLAGIFGTRSYMAGLAGRATSEAKAAAARANGAKGGRPRKSAG
jgi:Protein of unknown function (DUF2442)